MIAISDCLGVSILQAKKIRKEQPVWMKYGLQAAFTISLLCVGWYQYKSLTTKRKEQQEKARIREQQKQEMDAMKLKRNQQNIAER